MPFRKLLHIAAAGGLVLALSVVGSVAQARDAQAIPGTFRSEIVIANPNAVVANVTVNFVQSTGFTAPNGTVSQTVQPNSSAAIYVPNLPGLADGRYSVVIDSDQNVVAIANLASDSPSTATAYNGISQSEVGRSFNIPSVYRNYSPAVYSSSIVVQNAGTATANVTISYRQGSTVVATETRQIAANASSTFDQTTTAGLPDGFVGSAVVTADQDVAAIFLVSASGKLSSGRGARVGATSIYVPGLFHQYASYDSNLLVQNVDTTATTVSVTYYDFRTGAALSPAETAVIQPGATALFFQYDLYDGSTLTRQAVPRPGFEGAAVVRSTDNKQIIAVANVKNDARGYLEAFNGFAASSATTRANCPTIMNSYVGLYNTAVVVQNIGTVATNVTLTYYQGANIVKTETVANVAPNAGFSRYTPAQGLASNFKGSVVATSSGAPIIALVNELEGDGSIGNRDVLFTYSCANS